MTLRHEQRYQRALARIKPVQREEATKRALKELGYVTMPKEASEIVNVQWLIKHKLGERQ